ncbi:MAG: DNA repair protein, partial [Lachnospiraceae bacterium]|nr:DNA repair protein [Lachnospiraceae bacterium]
SKAYEKERWEYEELRRRFLNEQAGILARELVEGEPCPVCGSTAHPHPCLPKEGSEPLSREALEKREEKAAKLRDTQEKAALEARSAADLLKAKQENLTDRMAKALERMKASIAEMEPFSSGDLEAFFIEKVPPAVAQWKKRLEEEGKQRRVNARLLTKTRGQLSEAEKAEAALARTFQTASEHLAEEKTALERSRAVLEGIDIHEAFETEKDATEALKQAEGKRKQAEAAYSQAAKSARQALKEQENTKALIERYKAEIPKQEEEAARRKQAYEAILVQKELTDEQWRTLTEQYDRRKVEELRKGKEEHVRRKASAKSRMEQAKEAIGDQKRPDIAVLEAALKEAENEVAGIQKKLQTCRDEHKTNQDAYAALAPKREERSQKMEEHRRMDDLYSRLSGNVSGARMDIETYVQRYYLERVLFAANQRFLDMSAGQYELRMFDVQRAGEGKNRGLDLMVFSNVTGKEREVRTLSGGESFMAALSLALGMADTIQESSAAVQLDVMFIDEGFGSLDDHSRDQAVRVLQQMAAGEKTVGIISHVSELKTEIEDQLIVEKDEEGSRVHWVVS